MQPAPVDEYLGQPFRLADHQAAASVDLDEGLHAADRLDTRPLLFHPDEIHRLEPEVTVLTVDLPTVRSQQSAACALP